MTPKQNVLNLIHRLDDDVTIEEVIEKLHFVRKIEIGLRQADAGNLIDHDEFMDELDREAEEDQATS
jgi:hypothetical protein